MRPDQQHLNGAQILIALCIMAGTWIMVCLLVELAIFIRRRKRTRR